jgi:hypothetical protein
MCRESDRIRCAQSPQPSDLAGRVCVAATKLPQLDDVVGNAGSCGVRERVPTYRPAWVTMLLIAAEYQHQKDEKAWLMASDTLYQ